jgi:hypothetical protein
MGCLLFILDYHKSWSFAMTPCMLTKQVRAAHPRKLKKLERNATRPQDMPCCATCLKPIRDVAICGYDSRWRCCPCNEAHTKDVFRESGESAPLPSEDRPFKTPEQEAAGAAAKREARVKTMLERYGVTKRCT